MHLYLIINHTGSIITMTSEISQCFLIKPSYYFLNRIPCRTVGDRGFCYIFASIYSFILFRCFFIQYLFIQYLFYRSIFIWFLLVLLIAGCFFKSSAEFDLSFIINEHGIDMIHTLNQSAPLFYSQCETSCR